MSLSTRLWAWITKLPPAETFDMAYDRTQGTFAYRIYAERGFHVLVVSGRGTFGAGERFDPFRQERDDGQAILVWLNQQPWFNGVLGMTGASYLGYTQWASAADAGSMLQAMSTQLIGSNLQRMVYPGNTLALEVFAWWMSRIRLQEYPLWRNITSVISGTASLRKAVPYHYLKLTMR